MFSKSSNKSQKLPLLSSDNREIDQDQSFNGNRSKTDTQGSENSLLVAIIKRIFGGVKDSKSYHQLSDEPSVNEGGFSTRHEFGSNTDPLKGNGLGIGAVLNAEELPSTQFSKRSAPPEPLTKPGLEVDRL